MTFWDEIGGFLEDTFIEPIDEYVVQPIVGVAERLGEGLEELVVEPLSNDFRYLGNILQENIVNPISRDLDSLTGKKKLPGSVESLG